MSCLNETTLLRLVQGEPGVDVQAIDTHLDACSACRHLLVEVARTSLARGSAPTPASETEPTLPDPRARGGGDADVLGKGDFLGRYLVLGRLGAGGMGVVYAAYDPELDRRVALKLLLPDRDESGDARARLLREARTIARLQHPNVVAVHDVGTHNDRVFVAMELVNGGNLAEWLAARRRAPAEVVAMFAQAGRGLAAAHAAGLVHRDFKPANVLVGKEGRARVTDFGLAHEELSTEPGHLAGTPRYMAPEQRAAEAVDARADQYSFAVALQEALTGDRPAPPRVRRAVERALSPRREDRFPSMEALLGALETPRRRLPLGIAAAVIAAATVGFVFYQRHAVRATTVCKGSERKLAGVWDPARAQAVHAAFAASGKPYAEPTFQAVQGVFDRYAAGWVAMRTEACEATSLREEQSAEVLDLRMACLDQRLDDLRARVDLLAGADAETVAHASEAAGGLRPLAGCADVEALKAPVPPPGDRAIRAQAIELRHRLILAKAVGDAGKAKQALEMVKPIVDEAHRLGYRALEAEVLLIHGSLLHDAGMAKEAEASLRQAVLAAEESHNQQIEAQAWGGLLVAVGIDQTRYAEGIVYGEHARALLARLDPGGLLTADLENQLGTLLREKGDLAAARKVQEESIAILSRLLAPDDPRLARSLNNLANIEWMEGHLEPALAGFTRVHDMLVKTLGPNHPDVARALGNMANVVGDQGNYAESQALVEKALAVEEAALGPDNPELIPNLNHLANLASDLNHPEQALAVYGRALAIARKAYGEEHAYVSALLANIAIIEKDQGHRKEAREKLEQARAIEEKMLGPDHPGLANTLGTLGNLALDDGRFTEAEALHQRALAIRVKAFGPDSEKVTSSYVNLANVYAAEGHRDVAIVQMRKALAIQEKALGADHPDVGNTLYNLANQLYSTDDWAGAAELLARALTIFEKKLGPDHPYDAYVLTSLAGCKIKLKKDAEALPLLERALAIREKSQARDDEIAETWDTLAQALWATGGDRARARDLARKARAVYAAPGGDRARLSTLDKWMAARGNLPAMSCLNETTLLRLVQGEPGVDIDEIDSHLDGCSACRHLLVEVARTSIARGSGPAPASETEPTLPAPRLADGVLRKGDFLGRYLVLGRLGAGGMGVVYAAYDPELDRRIAVKLVRPDSEASGDGHERLLREARIIARLQHPNVVAVHDVGTHDDQVFVAMELVDGGNLAEWLDARPRAPGEVVAMFVQTGRGLAAAHAAGLVHRDFKPANVLVGKDGRARVTDFGLVYELSMLINIDSASQHIAGTPRYMAPEQRAAEAVDARADQYSFAVALQEALGDRPLPPRVRRAIERALSPRREDRFPSMEALLGALETPRRRLPLGIAAIVIAAASLGFIFYQRHATRAATVCKGSERKLAGVWDPARAQRVRAAFEASGKPYAEPTFQAVRGVFDRYASGWVAMRTEACEATSLREEQSAEVLDLRMACLDQRLDDLRARVDLLAGADADMVGHASEAAGGLRPLAGCADVEALKAPVPPPADKAIRAQALELRHRLILAKAVGDAGKPRQALALIIPLLEETRRLGYGSLEAEVLLTQGGLQHEIGDGKAAEQSLRQAVLAAEVSHHQQVEAQAWGGLLVAIGIDQTKYAEGLTYGEHAAALISRLDPGGRLEADLANQMSTLLREKGDLAEARKHSENAVAIYARVLAPDDPRLARAQSNLSSIDWMEGKYEQALAGYRAVEERILRTLGPAHPDESRALGNIANVLRDQGHYAEALAVQEKALAVGEASLGAESPELIPGLNELGNLAADLNHNEQALAYYGRALAIAEKAYGGEHAYVSVMLSNIGLIYKEEGRYPEAREKMERARAIDEKMLGPDHPSLAITLSTLGNIALEEGRFTDAEGLHQRALAIRLKAFGPESEEAANSYINLGSVAADEGHRDVAITQMRKALAILEKTLGRGHPKVANALYNLANQLYSTDHWADAAEALVRAQGIWEARVGPDHPNVARTLIVLAGCKLKLRKEAEALPLAERALAIREKSKVPAKELAETWDTLAQALWATGGDRARARQLAQKARAVYAAPGGDRTRLAFLDRWMTARGIARQ